MPAMTEMPPLQFADTNGIRMGYYDAGPKSDPYPHDPLPWLAGDRIFLAASD